MSGGHAKRGGLGIPLSDRRPGGRAPVAPVGRHCWVTGLPGADTAVAGVLVEWARHGDAWAGRVVYVLDEDGAPVLVEAWVPAEHLQPVQT